MPNASRMSRKWLAAILTILAVAVGGALLWQKCRDASSPERHLASQPPSATHYGRYVNARFAFSVPYPDKLLQMGEESDNGDGVRFASPDRHTEMAAWGSNNALEETLQSRFRDELREKSASGKPRKVTFKTIKNNWFVISGTEGDRIFYRKTYFSDDQFIVVDLRYPASQRTTWDPLVSHIAAGIRVCLTADAKDAS
ncbi:hypothetical protein [Chromobacterium phragmitis]|uniref:hypothetical protein n=1 Tax=Chromobacterium phragmitis TaxID=2202141 RepID=UPI0011AE8061|nr:hypothetical protein [Chromobacterium phragmitis]